MSQETMNLFISVDADGADDDERDNLAQQLLNDFDELDEHINRIGKRR